MWWRRGGLLVSALVSGSSSPVLALAGDIVFCSWARHFTLTVPLSTQVYKWVPANLISLMLGVNLRLTACSISSRGKQKYSRLLLTIKTVISSGLMGRLARMQPLPFYLTMLHNIQNENHFCNAFGWYTVGYSTSHLFIILVYKRVFYSKALYNYFKPWHWKCSREFKKTTTAKATGTSLNKRFDEQNNGCARAL